jgi:hypothetical protein
VNYPRRQRYRRLSRAGRSALAAAATAFFGILVLRIGPVLPGELLVAVAVGLAVRTRHWLSLAERSRVGARSEDEVRRVLAALEEQGWRLRHAVRWSGRGDIDSVAIAPCFSVGVPRATGSDRLPACQSLLTPRR